MTIMYKTVLLTFFLIFSQLTFAGRHILEIIPLSSRPASEVQALITPFLDSEDNVAADGYNLIIRTTPARLNEIKRLISQLDIEPHNLLITVVQGQNISARELNARATIKLSIPLDKSSAATSDITGRLQQNETQDYTGNTQKLRTLEGHTAYIKAGKTHPIQNTRLYDSSSGHAIISESTAYFEATTGFAVTPRLNGDQVILDINPWSDRMKQNRYFETREAHTIIRTRLGEWVEIGGQLQNEQINRSGILNKTERTQTERMYILLKVDKLN